ncbi:unnamed protein product [Polarella glacialis]|uniref:10 kDa chaperonin n=1 Tax=Polarella glacialis TaxID=89957 RepID=A0A813I101_POLGL|nr:unnamed protein product [Polarella glacialis]
MRNAIQNLNDEAKLQRRRPFFYIELTSKDVLPHWVPIESAGGKFSLKGEDDVQLTGNQEVATLNPLTEALSHRSSATWMGSCNLQKLNAVRAGQRMQRLSTMIWYENSSHGKERKDPNLDIGKEIQTVNKELLEQLPYSEDIMPETVADAELGFMTFPRPLEPGDLETKSFAGRIPVREEMSKGWRTRIVDHETESGANPATRPSDKISRDTLNALVVMILLVFPLGVEPGQWKGDVSKAFRRVPVFWQRREFAWVIWVQLNVLWVSQHKGMPFGTVSAVYSWHRVGHALLVLLLRLFLAPAARHVDDFFRANKAGVTWTAGRCLSVVSKLLGFPTEDSKDADHLICMTVLGAESKIDWAERANKKELNKALGIVFVVNHRSRWDSEVTGQSLSASDVGCVRCAAGQGGFKFNWVSCRWIPFWALTPHVLQPTWQSTCAPSSRVRAKCLTSGIRIALRGWKSPVDLYDLSQVVGAEDYLSMVLQRFRAAADAAVKSKQATRDKDEFSCVGCGPRLAERWQERRQALIRRWRDQACAGLLPEQTAGWGRTSGGKLFQACHASCAAEVLTKDNMTTLELDISQRLPSDFQSSARPRQQIACLAEASAQQYDVLPALEDRALYLKMMTNLRSLPSVASGLRSWHALAVNVLRYNEENTLSDEVKTVLRGLQKECIVNMPSSLGHKMLLTELLAQRLVSVADGVGNEEFSVFMQRPCSAMQTRTLGTEAHCWRFPSEIVKAPNWAKVLATGPGRVSKEGDLVPMNVKVGDTVVIPEYGGVTLKFDNEDYFVFRDEDMMGIIQEE